MEQSAIDLDPPRDYLRRQVPIGRELCTWNFCTSALIERKQWDPWYTLATDKIGDQLELRCHRKAKDNKLYSEKLHVTAVCRDDEQDDLSLPSARKQRRRGTKDKQDTTEILLLALCFPVNRNFDLKSTIIKECALKRGWKKQAAYLQSVAELFNVTCVVDAVISAAR